MKNKYKALLAIVIVLLISFVSMNNGGLFQGLLRRVPNIQSARQITQSRTTSASMIFDAAKVQRFNFERKPIDNRENAFKEFSMSSTKDAYEKEILQFPVVTGTSATKTKIPGNGPLAGTSTEKWEHSGPQGVGVTTSVDYSQTNHKHLLLGTEASGVYQSYDYGENWMKMNFPANNVDEVAIDPTNDNHYVVLANFTYVYESKDSGLNWTNVYTFSNANIYYRGSKNSDMSWNGSNIFVRVDNQSLISDNNGSSWQNYDLPLIQGVGANNQFRDTKIKNTGFGLHTVLYQKPGNNENNSRIYETQDFGKSWTVLVNETPGGVNGFDISSDGSRIIYTSETESSSGNPIRLFISSDGGAHWTLKPPTLKINGQTIDPWAVVQDLELDETDSNKIYMFYYMDGLFISTDGGKTFNQDISKYDTVPMKNSWDNSISLVAPLDLRLSAMKLVDGKIFLMPTDQGIFSYDTESNVVKIMDNGLYLGDTGQVSTTSCPRVYSGLWHLGQTYINPDNTSVLVRTGEQSYVGVDQDGGCAAATINGGKEYSSGENFIQSKTSWLNNIENLGWGPAFFNDGTWWFVFSQNMPLIRFDKGLTKYDVLEQNGVRSFYIERTATTPNYWILDNNGMLWKSTDMVNWAQFKDLSSFNMNILYGNSFEISLFVSNKLIAISRTEGLGQGLFISNDAGQTWMQKFAKAKASNVVQDSKGNLYVGLRPADSDQGTGKTEQWFDNDILGVWQSTDQGNTWNLYKQGTEKSWVSGLAIESTTNTLYASTYGESLLKIKLPFDLKINLIMPIINGYKWKGF